MTDELKSVAEKRYQATSQQATPVTHQRTKTKVSKWTRVKEAFRWEKAHVEPAASSNAKLMISAPLIKAAAPLTSKMLPAAMTLASPPPPPPPPPLPLTDLPAEETEDKSPVYSLRRTSTTASTSSSSLSECPLESEILKSFADAQELPRTSIYYHFYHFIIFRSHFYMFLYVLSLWLESNQAEFY